MLISQIALLSSQSPYLDDAGIFCKPELVRIFRREVTGVNSLPAIVLHGLEILR
jgi:hypothetical protein